MAPNELEKIMFNIVDEFAKLQGHFLPSVVSIPIIQAQSKITEVFLAIDVWKKRLEVKKYDD